MASHIDQSKYPICRHIKTNGRRCQSPAVHRATFCHFHRTLHDAHTKGFPPPNALGFMPVQHIEKMLSYGEPLAELAKAFPSPDRMTLPPLEDAESVQVAISLIFSDMASGHLDHERARPLLYALQLASYNFRTLAQIQTAQASQARREEPMAHRVVRSRKGHTLAAPNDDSQPALDKAAGRSDKSAGCPVQPESPASLLAGVEAPLGRDMAPKSPAPAEASSDSSPASPRRRKIARPDSAELPRLAALTDPAPAAISPSPGDIPEDHVEDHPISAEPAQALSHEAPWSGYLCDNHDESQSQSVPTSSQSARRAPISAPFSPCEDPEFPSAPLQPPPYEDFTRNSNGMTFLASASSPKPNPPLHLHPQPSRRRRGVPSIPPAHACKAAISPATLPPAGVISKSSPKGCRPVLTPADRDVPYACSGNSPKDVGFSK